MRNHNTPLVFEARVLKPYAQPVENEDLVCGSVYFFLTFLGSGLLLPTLEPVVFVGRNLEQGESGRVYFQDLASYENGIRYETEPQEERVEYVTQTPPLLDNASFYTGSENELGHVFTFEHALDQLLACSLRRRAHESRG